MIADLWDSAKMYLIAAALFLCLLLGAGGMWLLTSAQITSLRSDLATAQSQVEALTVASEARDRADKVRDAARAAVTKKTKEDHAALTQAVAAHRGWADEPVPDDVAVVLRNAARPASAP